MERGEPNGDGVGGGGGGGGEENSSSSNSARVVGRPASGNSSTSGAASGAVSIASLELGAAPGGAGRNRAGSPRRWAAVARLLRRLLLAMFLLAGLLAAIAALLFYMGPIFLVQLCVVALVAYFVAGGRLRWFYVALKTAPRDIK